jgi:hypothetical protein
MMTPAAQEGEKFNRSLIFGLLVGPIIYTLHFLTLYFLVEGSCKSGLARSEVFGFGVVSVIIFALTMIATAMALFGGYLSYRGWRHSRDDPERQQDAYSLVIASLGIWLNGFFALLILLTGLPTLLLVLCDWI